MINIQKQKWEKHTQINEKERVETNNNEYDKKKKKYQEKK